MRFSRAHFRMIVVLISVPAAWARAQSESQPERILPGEGRTLPEKVFRARIPYKYFSADYGFSSAKKREESGFRLNASAIAAVIEYGYSNAVAFQVVVPYVTQSKLSLDGTLFQKSSLYLEKYDSFILAAANKLVADGLCAAAEACVDVINRQGLALPFDSLLTLPTGESLPVKAGVPLRDVGSALVTRAAIPTSGKTGVGDVEFGALFALADPTVGLFRQNWPVNLSAGAGLRFPSGSFSDVPASQRGTGRGTLDLGLRVNLDWQWTKDAVVSFQHQSEWMLRSGQKKRPSLLDSSALNSGDPTRSGADQIANTAALKREGARQVGFLKAAFAATPLSAALSPVILNAQWKYDFDPQTNLGGKPFVSASQLQSAQVGFEWDGLLLNIPLQIAVDYEVPWAGQDRPVAPTVLTTTLKAFYRL